MLHHTLLHNDQPLQQQAQLNPNAQPFGAQAESSQQLAVIEPPLNALLSHNQYSKSLVLLPTAVVLVKDASGKLQKCRLLLDSWSMVTFISESCTQRLALNRKQARVSNGLASVAADVTRGVTSLPLVSAHYKQSTLPIEALILSKISSNIPTTNIQLDSMQSSFVNAF